jgi:adenine-specific DNA-methyltransferase
MAAKYPYYLLADSPEGVRREAEVTGQSPTHPSPLTTHPDVRKGFVYRRVPHVTLKSIANNPDIKEGMSREEIDKAIARHADTELLYDQPYEDAKRIRVTGPFTVETLSPHRVLSTQEERPASEKEAKEAAGPGQFETMILENLRKAGVQNRIKNERLVFDRLEPYAGQWLHAEGEYTEKDGASRRVAVCIGPEHGTVGPELVKEAAKEAVKGVGFDLVIVCGFALTPTPTRSPRNSARHGASWTPSRRPRAPTPSWPSPRPTTAS